ncbi:MAG: ABC transporter ATP-binding protein [Alphaproteobacteria bacterium]|nr:ABC transporter ATP-binding protein [Alphaproteobacteria bacterium]
MKTVVPPVLNVENLEVRYGAVVAATGISLTVHRGEVVALLGPNGAGKTSVLHAIMGFVKPAAGSVSFFDGRYVHDIAGLEAHRMAHLGIAIVPSAQVVLPRMVVEENLEVGGLFLLHDRTEVHRRMTALFERFPVLAQRRKQYAATLSGGEQRQLAIARGLMAKPKLMLLDEPSLGLAPMILKEIFALLRRINREDGVDILIVEQNVNKALEIADRAYVMRIGGIDFSGTSAEVAEGERLKDAYLGT